MGCLSILSALQFPLPPAASSNRTCARGGEREPRAESVTQARSARTYTPHTHRHRGEGKGSRGLACSCVDANQSTSPRAGGRAPTTRRLIQLLASLLMPAPALSQPVAWDANLFVEVTLGPAAAAVAATAACGFSFGSCGV